VAGLLPFGEYIDLTKRKIKQTTCEKFGYYVVDTEGGKAQVAQYRDQDGAICGQKVRTMKNGKKHFYATGEMKNVQLFGQHLWKRDGKRIIITEGEIDALSVSEVIGTWPVVSIPTGAEGAARAIAVNIEFLESYETVVLCFDMDEPGQRAARECVDLFTPGKVCIAQLPLKDASEMVQANRFKELNNALWEAQVARPDGIVCGADLWEQVSTPVVMGKPYPWAGLNEKLYGQRGGEIVTWCAGSGIGKSALVAETTFANIMRDIEHDVVGYIALEENTARTGRRFMGMYLNKPIHLPGHDVDPALLREAFEVTLGTRRLWTYDHFGSVVAENLLSKMRYLVKACGCTRLVLDHLSIVISDSEDDDERKAIDRLMTKLRTFTEETGVGMDLVSHLKRPPGLGHEDGAQVSLAHLRGSAAIAQLSDAVIGVERNQQAETEDERNTTVLRVVKNRYAGLTGPAVALRYDHTTGRLTETAMPGEGEGFQDESGAESKSTDY
jgi:twinkle protein